MIDCTKNKIKSLYGAKKWQSGAIPLCFWEHLCGILCALSLLVGCSTVKYIPTETKVETVTNYVDSVRVRDSIVVIPIERYMDIVPAYDTLHLETTMAKAEAYVDTNFHILRGSIENKKGLKYEEKKIERQTEKSDTLKIYKEVPVPVEVEKTVVPKWAWWSAAINLLFILGISLRIYLRRRI